MRLVEIDILIIGAGPAGLAAAMELSRAGKEFIILEKEGQVGGLAKTYVFREGELEFRTDNGPHRFFSKNPYLYGFIEGLIGEQWIKVKRQTRQFIDKKFYDYPVNALQALRNMGYRTAFLILIDYFYAKVRYQLFKAPIRTFEDYAVANFGRRLADFNIINYTEKIWGIPASTIHPDWAQQRIKGLSLFTVFWNMLQKLAYGRAAHKPKSLVDEFYYPDLGAGLVYETIQKKLEGMGYEILLETKPTRVGVVSKGFVVHAVHAGEELEIRCGTLIETVPIAQFVRLLTPTAPQKVSDALGALRYRSQVYLFLTIGKEKVTDDQWIYFPDKRTPIARVSEMNNFSKKMSPAGMTSLFVEFFCFEGDEIWNMEKEDLFELAIRDLESFGFVKRAEVRNAYHIRSLNSYPIYDLSYKEHLATVKDYLDAIPNLFYIGRPGRFHYNNQDHSLEMGIAAARSIIEGTRQDFDHIGSEGEYFEKGSVVTSGSARPRSS